jgi:hypothetical protein
MPIIDNTGRRATSTLPSVPLRSRPSGVIPAFLCSLWVPQADHNLGGMAENERFRATLPNAMKTKD